MKLDLEVVEQWRLSEIPNVAPEDYLHAWIRINGGDFHLTAIRVLPPGDDGIRHAAAPDLDEWLDAATVLNGDGAFQTTRITIAGEPGDYVIVGTNFACLGRR